MARGYARLRERNQITLPSSIVEQMGLRTGDIIEFDSNARGTFELHPARIVKADSPDAVQDIKEANQEISQGKFTELNSLDDIRRHIEQLRQGETPALTAKADRARRKNGMPEASHLSESQKEDVEAVVQTALLKLFSNLLNSQYTIRRHEEGAVDQR